jgi:DNA-binding CsgD family transcriptional regulator
MTALQTTLDGLDLGVVHFDRRLRLVAWNRPLFDMLGYPRRLARHGTSFLDFVGYNIDRGEHGDHPRDVIIRNRLACRYSNYSRRRADGTLLTVRSRRLVDGGFLKQFFTVATIGECGPLTSREHDVMEWAANGKTAAETATILGISERTVEFHVANAVARLGATNKTQAVALAVTAGLISVGRVQSAIGPV